MRERIRFLKDREIPEKIGVYIVFLHNSEALYIGSSTNLRRRLKDPHRIAKKINQYDDDDLSIGLYAYATIDGARRAEKEYIKSQKPKLNGKGRPKILNDPVPIRILIERETMTAIDHRFPHADKSVAIRAIINRFFELEDIVKESTNDPA